MIGRYLLTGRVAHRYNLESLATGTNFEFIPSEALRRFGQIHAWFGQVLECGRSIWLKMQQFAVLSSDLV